MSVWGNQASDAQWPGTRKQFRQGWFSRQVGNYETQNPVLQSRQGWFSPQVGNYETQNPVLQSLQIMQT